MRDPRAVAAIVGALRHAHGDDVARAMLQNGMSLAVLIDALLAQLSNNHDAAKLMSVARNRVTLTLLDFKAMSHIKYVTLVRSLNGRHRHADQDRSFAALDWLRLRADELCLEMFRLRPQGVASAGCAPRSEATEPVTPPRSIIERASPFKNGANIVAHRRRKLAAAFKTIYIF